MTKHTPGPWTVRLVVDDAASETAYRVEPLAKGDRIEQATEENANARLIAAAPELLEFARTCSDWDVEKSPDEGGLSVLDVIDAARALLDRIGGES